MEDIVDMIAARVLMEIKNLNTPLEDPSFLNDATVAIRAGVRQGIAFVRETHVGVIETPDKVRSSDFSTPPAAT